MILLAIHGILTGRSDVTWPERLQAFAHRNATTCPDSFVVLTDQYDAGPFPRLNWFFGNPKMARGMARRILSWLEDGVHERVTLVGHSNGCDIVRRVAMQLAEMEVTVEAVILIAPPLSPRLSANGLQACIDSGHLRRVVCYFTPRDTVLAPAVTANPFTWLLTAIRWPYGNMGRVGISEAITVEATDPAPAGVVAFNRVFPTYWHTTYFSRPTTPETFKTILSDACVD